MTLVKICGVCDVAGAVAAVEAGADMIGLHFCTSPRRLGPAEARRIVSALQRRPVIVGVFIDADPEEIGAVAAEVGLDMAQLHGSEDPATVWPLPVMKVLKVRDGVVPPAESWPDPLLLDTWSDDQRGGTGRGWDWDLARPLVADRRVFVAGGLDPENVGRLVHALAPHGVDVSSGVESAPRHKDPALMRAFVSAVRQAESVRT